MNNPNNQAKRKLVILTGAGVSAESGISTFRDSDGLWENYPVQDVASIEGVSLLRIAYGAVFHQLAMEVYHLAAARTLVEVVHILRHDGHIVLTLQLS